MPSLDKAFGIHEQAMNIYARRTELLAGNLANADTPGYKARDLDFKALLSDYATREAGGTGSSMQATHANHFGGMGADGMGGDPLYRSPMQPSIDGNTVDSQVEKAAFMENSVRYQATMNFIDGRMRSLRKALRGD